MDNNAQYSHMTFSQMMKRIDAQIRSLTKEGLENVDLYISTNVDGNHKDKFHIDNIWTEKQNGRLTIVFEYNTYSAIPISESKNLL